MARAQRLNLKAGSISRGDAVGGIPRPRGGTLGHPGRNSYSLRLRSGWQIFWRLNLNGDGSESQFLAFPHNWTAEILPSRPLDSSQAAVRLSAACRRGGTGRHGADGAALRMPSLSWQRALCGFADPAAPSGVWSCPHPDWLCAMSGGYAYLVDVTDPEHFVQVEYRPVLEVRAVPKHRLLLFAGHHSMLAWGADGKAWQTERLSSEGVAITSMDGDVLARGGAGILMSDADVPFAIDLRSGERL